MLALSHMDILHLHISLPESPLSKCMCTFDPMGHGEIVCL